MRVFRMALLAAPLAGLVSGPASAAPREVAPLSAADCQKLADVFSKRLNGMAITVSMTGKPSDIAERLDVSGSGCELKGSKTGMPRNFYFGTLDEPYFKGWDQVLPVAADGPNGEIFGYSQGPKVVIYDYHFGVPEKLCANAKDFDSCETKYRKQWVYDFKATVFGFVDGGPITEKDFKQ